MSEGDIKQEIEIPSFLTEFPSTRVPSVSMDGPAALKFLARSKLKAGGVFWLTDGEFRVQSTLVKEGDSHSARVHWGMIQEIVVNGSD